MMYADPHTPKIRSEVEMNSGEQASLPNLLVTPVGVMACDCPSMLVDTLRRSHDFGLCHIDVCGNNMFAVQSNLVEDGIVEYKVILKLDDDLRSAARGSTLDTTM